MADRNIMSAMKRIGTTLIAALCLLSLLFIASSALAKRARPSRASKTAVANANAKFENDTNATLREITAELKTKLSQDDLKAIKDDLRKVEQKADEAAFEVRTGMLVGAAIAIVLGVFIYRLFSRITPDSGKQLSIT